MFGHQDDQSAKQDPNYISDQSIEGAMAGDTSQTVQPSAAPAPVGTAAPSDGAATATAVPATDSDTVDTNGLIDIKQQALTQLQPLIGHLEQTAEEKFRTTMMMIQASDDQSLIKTAFEAAQAITDEKVRAQALLDIVNEINYFTQGHPDQA